MKITQSFQALPATLKNLLFVALLIHLLAMSASLYGNDLSHAVRSVDSADVQQALKSGGNPNRLDAAAVSPLYHAVVSRSPRLVGMLLDAGAKPHVDGQSREPLWAACVNGDAEIISLLLKRGADPESGILPLRAVDGAVMSGRVGILKMLKEAKPGMTLPYLLPKDSDAFSSSRDMFQPSVDNTIDDAMEQRHFEMATYLVREGAYKAGSQFDTNNLLLRAVGLQPVQMDLIEALLQAGANPIVRADADWSIIHDYMMPHSPLEVAAQMGRAELVKRLASGSLNETAANRLLTIAMMSQNEPTLALVRAFVPAAKPFDPARRPTGPDFKLGPEASPRNSWDTKASAELLLMPRVKAPLPVAGISDGKSRAAVIADGQSGGEADLLAARLSMIEGIEVLDRDEVAAVLRERDFSFESKKEIAEIGDRLRADELVLVSKPGTKADGVLRAEIVDVRTGLITQRMHTAAAGFDPDPWVAAVNAAIRRSKERAKASADGLNYVTLLGVGAIEGMRGGEAIRSLVSAALMAEVDATPECISMTRLQMKPLLEEQALGGKGSLWKTGWAIEAGAAALDDGRIELRFRLRNLRTDESYDTSVNGAANQVGELVSRAWSDLIVKSQIGKTGDQHTKSESNEAKTLLNEAQWRFRLREYEAAAQLADAVCVMQGSDPETHLLRISARVRCLIPPFDMERSDNHTWVRGTVLYDIEGWLETLALMNGHFDEVFTAAVRRQEVLKGKGGTKPDGGPDEWLRILIQHRAATPAWAVRPDERDVLAEFERELERWCRRLYQKCTDNLDQGRLILGTFEVAMHLGGTDLRHMPWLPEATAGLLTKRFHQYAGNRQAQSLAARDLYEAINYLSLQPRKKFDVISVMLGAPDGNGATGMNAFRQDAAFISAMNAGRAEQARAISIRHMDAIRSGKPETVHLLPLSRLARYHVIERREFTPLPETSADLLVPSPASGIPSAELLRHLGVYAALRAPDRQTLGERLVTSAALSASKELVPGAARLRGRVGSVMQFAKLQDKQLKAFIEKLPPDPPADGEAATEVSDTPEEGAYFALLKEGPSGAKFFIVSNVVPDDHRGLVWWAGCFVRQKVMGDSSSQEEIIPGLVRVNLATGATAIATFTNSWLTWKTSDKMINPNAMSVHTNEKAVVWHVACNGVWQVDPATMALDPLLDHIAYLPSSMQTGPQASALVDDVFFVAEEFWINNGKHQRVLRLRRGEPQVVVVETGRRPILSELDTERTQLTMLAVKDDKIRIMANTEPAFLKEGIKMVSFEPSGKPIDGSLNKEHRSVEKALFETWQDKKTIPTVHKSWPLKSGGELRSAGKPGMLELIRNGEKTLLRVRLPLPDGFDLAFHDRSIDATGVQSSELTDISTAKFVASHANPVIVHQDGDTFGIMLGWDNGRYLFPIVWRVKESDIVPVAAE